MPSPKYDADLELFINGAWRSGEGRNTSDVVNPATAKQIADLPNVKDSDLDEALEAAEKGSREWRNTGIEERGAILHKAAALIRERSEDIARLMTMEQGKPIGEARGEVAGSTAQFDFFAEEAKRAYGRVLVRPAGERSLVLKKPVGPVAAFSPWNFPCYLMAKKMAPALAAGCSIIAKPPEETPGCTSAMFRCLIDAGLPGNVGQLVYGDADKVSRHLIASNVIRKVSFTGSVPVGKHLMRLCADGVKRMTMELGGHAPVLIFDDVDVDAVLDKVVPQKFRNSGQVCVSPTRFYVQQGIYDKFVKGFTERSKDWPVGNGLDEKNRMGPLANSRRGEAVSKLVDEAVSRGAQLKVGGHAYEDTRGDGFFFQPTVLSDVPLEADIMNQEPFGPVAMMRPFETLDDAIEQANRLPYGLAAFAFTNNAHIANMLGDEVEAGMLGINTFAISVPDAPFGGVKESGFGSEGGIEGLESYLVTKAVHQV